MLALLSSFAAGMLTTLNPCVLPVLPIVAATAFQGGRFGPLALAAGLSVGFTAIAIAVAATGAVLGLDPSILRSFGAVMFILAGCLFLFRSWQDGLARVMAPLAERANALSFGADASSLFGQFAIGLLLGVVWSPCSGPALGAAIGLAAQAGGLDDAAVRMVFFGLGAGTILALFAYGSRLALAADKAKLMRFANAAKPVAGAAFIALGALTLTGYDKAIERAATNAMPDWLIALTTSI
jgi:cytochrome c biogenesis protein CcdA